MKRSIFYRKNSSAGVYVSSEHDIIACMGEIGHSIESIDILNSGLVIGYIGGQGVTLGRIIEE